MIAHIYYLGILIVTLRDHKINKNYYYFRKNINHYYF